MVVVWLYCGGGGAGILSFCSALFIVELSPTGVSGRFVLSATTSWYTAKVKRPYHVFQMWMRQVAHERDALFYLIKMQLRYLVSRRRILLLQYTLLVRFVIIFLVIENFAADSLSKLFDHIGELLLIKIFYWKSRRIYRQPKNRTQIHNIFSVYDVAIPTLHTFG